MLLDHAVKHALGFWQALCHSYEGQLLIKRGDAAGGVRCFRTGLTELREAGYVLRLPGLLGALAEGMAAAGQVAQALMVIDEALAECEHTDERWSMTELLRIKGELLLLEGAPDAPAAAENLFQQGLNWARRQAALSSELRCASSLARLWHNRARSEESRQLLLPIYNRFTEGFATSDQGVARSLMKEMA